jgi:hypothetical protein
MNLVPLLAFPFLHDALAKLYKVSAGAKVSTSQIELRYKIEAKTPEAFQEIILPVIAKKPARKDELWNSTCFECFLPGKNMKTYLEFNGSPSGDWNWFSFQDYRAGMKAVPLSARIEPKAVSMSKSERELEVTWILPMSGVLQGFASHGESVQSFDPMGLTVVLHTKAATLYFALAHDGVKPDFHTRASFRYDSVRN